MAPESGTRLDPIGSSSVADMASALGALCAGASGAGAAGGSGADAAGASGSGAAGGSGPDAAGASGSGAADASGSDATDGGELIDTIRALEELKSAASAAQARAAAIFDAGQRAAQRAAGVAKEELGRGVGAQVALARRESPYRGGRLLGMAKALVAEMPRTMVALESGLLNEWRATILVRETACLSREDRTRVDDELAADTGALEGFGDRRLANEARRIAYRLDASAAVARASKATSERHVSCRPAPDTMTYVTGLLPVADGVSVYAALARAADSARASGDDRARGQVMADTLVDRVTGRAAAPGIERVEIQLVMTDRTLLAGDAEPAYLPGYGIVPAAWARALVAGAVGGAADPCRDPAVDAGAEPDARLSGALGRIFAHAQGRVWLRRLFTAPGSGRLVAMESRARLFPSALARMIEIRDQTCRTPWCDAPIRQSDHVLPWFGGGPTSEANGQGLCEACNQTKETPGWRTQTRAGPRHRVRTCTPVGRVYDSTAPPLPGHSSPVRQTFTRLAEATSAGAARR